MLVYRIHITKLKTYGHISKVNDVLFINIDVKKNGPISTSVVRQRAHAVFWQQCKKRCPVKLDFDAAALGWKDGAE